MLVDMERSYITAGFFRYTMSRRFEASQSQAAVQKALNKVWLNCVCWPCTAPSSLWHPISSCVHSSWQCTPAQK